MLNREYLIPQALKLEKEQDLRNSTRIFELKLSQEIGNQSLREHCMFRQPEVDRAQLDGGLREARLRLSSAARAL